MPLQVTQSGMRCGAGMNSGTPVVL